MNTLSNERLFVKKAHKTQLKMARHIILEDKLPKKIHLIGGVDVAYFGDLSIGAVVVLNKTDLEPRESQIAICKTRAPYIPTLLSFREISPMIKAIRKLEIQPDLFLVDGQGFAHPYHCGLASHLGIIIGKPTIGVAKNKLCGQLENAKPKTNVAFLKDENEIIGAAVTIEKKKKPIYISSGHMVSLETAIKIVKQCTKSNRLPEPLRRAHEVATVEKRRIEILSRIDKKPANPRPLYLHR